MSKSNNAKKVRLPMARGNMGSMKKDKKKKGKMPPQLMDRFKKAAEEKAKRKG